MTDDVNGDGTSDIFWQNTNGAIAVYEQNGLTTIGGGGLANPGTSWILVGTSQFYTAPATPTSCSRTPTRRPRSGRWTARI